MENKFNELYALNVNEKTEKKDDLTYLSWAWAWAEFKKVYPDATYNVRKNEQNLPYFESEYGIMVYTEVTAGGLTYEMWLPVMDGKNRTMKKEPYSYSTKYGDKKVEPATMTDINKTLMRCLTKNLAMFGLGLYIYAGEDLPEGETEKKPIEEMDKPKTPVKPAETKNPKVDKPKAPIETPKERPYKAPTAAQLDEIKNYNGTLKQIATYLKKDVKEVSYYDIEDILNKKRKVIKEAEEKAINEAMAKEGVNE
jgi:hypothetical protein